MGHPPLLPLILFAITYAGLALGRIPGLALDRTGLAVLGAVAFLATGGQGGAPHGGGHGPLPLPRAGAAHGFGDRRVRAHQPADADARPDGPRGLVPARSLRGPVHRRARPGGLRLDGGRPQRPHRGGRRSFSSGRAAGRRLAALAAGGERAGGDAAPPLRGAAAGHRYALALASTFAGNAVLVGSIANLIVAEQAARLGARLGFREHLATGLPVTLISLAFAAGVLLLGRL